MRSWRWPEDEAAYYAMDPLYEGDTVALELSFIGRLSFTGGYTKLLEWDVHV